MAKDKDVNININQPVPGSQTPAQGSQPTPVQRDILVAMDAAQKVHARQEAADAEDSDLGDRKKQALASMILQGGTGSADDLQKQALSMLIESLSEDLSDKRKKKAAAEEEMRRLMLARTDGLKIEKARKQATQTACDHRKEDGRTRLGGQRLSNGHLVLMCGYCGKEYDETSVPPHLIPNGDWIGG